MMNILLSIIYYINAQINYGMICYNIHNRDSMLEDILNINSSFNKEELEFISKHDEELK